MLTLTHGARSDETFMCVQSKLATDEASSSSSKWTIPSDDATDDAVITQHFFRVSTGRMVFAARMTTMQDGAATVDFAVPARPGARACLIFNAFNGETDVVLQHVHYEEPCALEGGLKAVGGARATRDMLRVGIVAAKRLLAAVMPGLTTLSFSDKSGFPCEPVGEVPLATHSLLLYGATWYERVLPNVVPYRDELASLLDRMRSRLAAPVEAPFSAFWAQAFGARATQRQLVVDAHDGVRAAYRAALATDPAASWNAVFQEINRKVGCFVFVHVIETLMRTKRWTFPSLGEPWRVNLDAVEHDVEVIIESLDGPATGGGTSVGASKRSRLLKLSIARRAVKHGIETFRTLEARRARTVIAAKRRGRMA